MKGDGARILVVDDYADNRATYGAWLREISRVEVMEAPDATHALQLARDHSFAMFLIDLELPEMDGFELASRLRQAPRTESTPIVFVGAESGPQHLETHGYRVGAVDFLVPTPVHGEVLVSKARVFVEVYRQQQELRNAIERVRRENQDLHARLEQFVRERETLRARATQDALTGLPNRLILHDRVGAAIARANRAGRRFALAHVAVDGARPLRELHGPAAGDQLLVALGSRLSGLLRATDTVARLADEEFGVVFGEFDTPPAAERLAGKLCEALRAPVVVESRAGVRVPAAHGVSIGVAVYPDDAREVESLIVLADLTLRAIRSAGGGVALHGLVARPPKS